MGQNDRSITCSDTDNYDEALNEYIGISTKKSSEQNKLIMKKILFILLFQFIALGCKGQNIYSKAYGNKQGNPVIYLHGGPGYNSVVFQKITAKKMAADSNYVIIYDRRGVGRSSEKNAKYTFKQTFSDLNHIYEKYHIQKATILGHSFGGIIATLYAEKNPNRVKSLVLISVPISFQQTFKYIIKESKAIYKKKHDSVNLKYVKMLQNMDSTSLQYSSYVFMHAMQNGFYRANNLSKIADSIYANFKNDSTIKKYGSKNNYKAVQGFYNNEHYTTLNIAGDLGKLEKKWGQNLWRLRKARWSNFPKRSEPATVHYRYK